MCYSSKAACTVLFLEKTSIMSKLMTFSINVRENQRGNKNGQPRKIVITGHTTHDESVQSKNHNAKN